MSEIYGLTEKQELLEIINEVKFDIFVNNRSQEYGFRKAVVKQIFGGLISPSQSEAITIINNSKKLFMEVETNERIIEMINNIRVQLLGRLIRFSSLDNPMKAYRKSEVYLIDSIFDSLFLSGSCEIDLEDYSELEEEDTNLELEEALTKLFKLTRKEVKEPTISNVVEPESTIYTSLGKAPFISILYKEKIDSLAGKAKEQMQKMKENEQLNKVKDSTKETVEKVKSSEEYTKVKDATKETVEKVKQSEEYNKAKDKAQDILNKLKETDLKEVSEKIKSYDYTGKAKDVKESEPVKKLVEELSNVFSSLITPKPTIDENDSDLDSGLDIEEELLLSEKTQLDELLERFKNEETLSDDDFSFVVKTIVNSFGTLEENDGTIQRYSYGNVTLDLVDKNSTLSDLVGKSANSVIALGDKEYNVFLRF